MKASPSAPTSEQAAPLAADAGQAMTRALEHLAAVGRRSTADMLSELRRQFPNAPLAVRVRALEALRTR